MTYRGKVKGGMVVLEPGARLDEGAEVVVEPVGSGDEYASLREGLLKLAGTVKGLPSDMSRNHDHYIHGAPKR
ncbi:MAG: hypothetical protein HY718_13930 [Planctomycetes bacterium]|nr:hypothetical protein [Planctomycetota bacterium]